MIPYADFLYFGVLLYVVVPTLILGLAGRAGRRWIVVATLAMLAVQYGGSLRVRPGTEIRELWIVVGYAVFEWAVALLFVRARSRASGRWTFYVALLLALMPMVVAKYVPAVEPHFQLGFLGISYVTLRALDVIICTQDRLITSLPPAQFFAYLFFFATISSGPIDRYRRFATDWQHSRTRAELLADLDGAVQRIFIGFFYKFILAALIKQYWLDRVAGQSDLLSTWSYMYAYSFYLFFDFAGYSAFAIGISYVFGVHTPENFDRPFLAHNIRDFWNRWHITLSTWLRDHIYMRFVMAATKGRWFASRYLASYLGFFLAFGLMGLWHGTAPHYLLYGVYHGALLAAHDAFARWNKRRHLWGDGLLWQAASVFVTFHCVCFGFLLFSGHLTIGGGAERAAANGSASADAGQLEKATCEEIGGWAWDARHPEEPVSVDIHADGSRIGSARADLFRPDLAGSGKGSGAHGFVYVPPPALLDGWPHSITLRVSGTDIELGDGPRTIVCGMHARAMDGYDGAHETADCERISGWAWDTTQPDRTIRVDIYDGETRLGTAAADQVRDESDSADDSTGRRGFVLLTPSELKDGRPHSISVRIAGSNVALQHTPQILTCSDRSAAPSRPTATPRAGGSAGATARATPGAPPPTYRDNRDGTISAMHTGLMWEKKVRLDETRDAANLHDADNCYGWFGSCASGGTQCRVDADCGTSGPCNADDCQSSAPGGLTIFEWVARLNATRFAGYSDWRLPSSSELYSIVTPLEEDNPATIAAFKGASCGTDCTNLADPACSCTHSGLYWAAPPSAPSPDESWMMFFYCNGHLFLDLKTNKFQVRAVRESG